MDSSTKSQISTTKLSTDTSNASSRKMGTAFSLNFKLSGQTLAWETYILLGKANRRNALERVDFDEVVVYLLDNETIWPPR